MSCIARLVCVVDEDGEVIDRAMEIVSDGRADEAS